jgi:uncharacterized protein YdcH (DUF465 family)
MSTQKAIEDFEQRMNESKNLMDKHQSMEQEINNLITNKNNIEAKKMVELYYEKIKYPENILPENICFLMLCFERKNFDLLEYFISKRTSISQIKHAIKPENYSEYTNYIRTQKLKKLL